MGEMIIYIHKCDGCSFSLPSGWGGCMYVTDDEGKRFICPHPVEASTISRVLGFDEKIPLFMSQWDLSKTWHRHSVPMDGNAVQKLLDERLGFMSECVCLDCVSTFRLDLKRDAAECPECCSQRIRSVSKIVGEQCPKCGKGTIRKIDVGIIS
jgi:hypothetical protein